MVKSRRIGRIILISILLILTLGTFIINLSEFRSRDPVFQAVRAVYSYVYLLVLIPFGMLFFKWLKKEEPGIWLHISFLMFLGYGLINLIFIRQIAYGGIAFFWAVMLLLYISYPGILFSKQRAIK